MIRANNPQLKSWVPVSEHSDFPIQNLPFGVFQTEGISPRVCTAIGDQVADLHVLWQHGFFEDLALPHEIFLRPWLNEFMALGRAATRAVRNRLSMILDDDLEEWDASELADYFLHPRSQVELLLPVRIGDYTDFYSSREHAVNVGSLFRDPERALPPNWLHLPIGYHGRASSIVVSGTPIRRPAGQRTPPAPNAMPEFGPSRALDYELEVAFVTGVGSPLGQPIPVRQAEEHIFGLLLFNDWSARDIQRWEYQPLGPFLGKSFASTVAPWVVSLDALEPFRSGGPTQSPEPLPYLQTRGATHFDIHLEAYLQPRGSEAQRICCTNHAYLYWSISQQLAHQSVNGCNIRPGDLYASGTISGSAPESYGSLLERTRNGAEPLRLDDGTQRRFLEDGDRVILRGWCEKEGVRIGFGEAEGVILP